MVDQREWNVGSAVFGEAVEHALLDERVVFRLEIALRDRGPGCQIVERITSSVCVGGPEKQLYRGHLAYEPGEMASEFRQRGVVGGLEQWQQGLADRAPLSSNAAQQQLLAFLVSRAELEVEEDWNQDEDDG